MIPIIGLTGGIASGKSTVADFLKNFGAKVINADRLANEAIYYYKDEIAAFFGSHTFNKDGSLDRKRLRRQIVGDPLLLIDLEDILHPRVKRQILTETNHLNHLKENPAIVWDVPLLFEIGWENKCDHIIFVSCSEKIRIERVKTYRDWDEVFYKVVQSCQKCPEYKQSHADFVINNDILIMTELRDQVKTIFQKITNCNCV